MAKKQLLKNCGNVLAEGEVTGHKHRVEVAVIERPDGIRIFDGATKVTHEEHKPITLPKEKWASGKVQEFDHSEQIVRNVTD